MRVWSAFRDLLGLGGLGLVFTVMSLLTPQLALAQGEGGACEDNSNRVARFFGGSYVSSHQLCGLEAQVQAQREMAQAAEVRAASAVEERDLALSMVADLEATMEARGSCDVDELQAALASSRARNTELLSSLDALTSQIAGLDLQSAQLRQTIDALDAQLGAAELDAEAKMMEIQGLQAALAASEAKSLALSLERDGLLARLGDLSGEQPAAPATSNLAPETSARLEEAESRADSLAVELNTLRENNSMQFDAYVIDLAKAEAALERKDGQIAALQATITTLQAGGGAGDGAGGAGEAGEGQQDLLARLSEEAGQVPGLRREIARLTADLDAASRLATASNGASEQLARMQALNKKLSQDLAAVQAARASTLSVKAALEGQLRETLDRLADLEAQGARDQGLETRLGDLGAKLAAMETENDRLRDLLSGTAPSESAQMLSAALRRWMEQSRSEGPTMEGLFLNDGRFVLSSDASLFQPGSARLSPSGNAVLADLAGALRDTIDTLPPNAPWSLQVQGHADASPAGSRWPSNWELSSFRATMVVRTLVDAGLPAERLSAVGLGVFHPLVDGDDQEAYAKNRRIELQFR